VRACSICLMGGESVKNRLRSRYRIIYRSARIQTGTISQPSLTFGTCQNCCEKQTQWIRYYSGQTIYIGGGDSDKIPLRKRAIVYVNRKENQNSWQHIIKPFISA